jgi:hypothetical protein
MDINKTNPNLHPKAKYILKKRKPLLKFIRDKIL